MLYKLSYILVLNLVMHFICRVFLENMQGSNGICSLIHRPYSSRGHLIAISVRWIQSDSRHLCRLFYVLVRFLFQRNYGLSSDVRGETPREVAKHEQERYCSVTVHCATRS